MSALGELAARDGEEHEMVEITDMEEREGKASVKDAYEGYHSVTLAVGAPNVTGFLVILCELLLIFTTTVLLYLALEAGSVLNAECDLRGLLPEFERDLLFMCDDLPSVAHLESIFARQNYSLPYAAKQLESTCEGYMQMMLGYVMAVELFLVVVIVFMLKQNIERTHNVVELLQEGATTYHRLHLPMHLQTHGFIMFVMILVVNFLLVYLLQENHSNEQTNYCSWEPDVVFAWTLFFWTNAAFLGLLIITSFPAYCKYKRRFNRNLPIFLRMIGASEYYNTKEKRKKYNRYFSRPTADPCCRQINKFEHSFDKQNWILRIELQEMPADGILKIRNL